MMRKHIPKYSLIVISLLFAILIGGISSADPWWDSDWDSLSNVTLNRTAPELDLQVHISSNDFTIPAKMWANLDKSGNDTRILSSDNTTVFPIWIDHLTAADNYSLWVNITYATGTRLNWYYGNPNATSISDIETTFVFGDNFKGTSLNTTKWDTAIKSPGAITVNNRLELNPQSTSTFSGAGLIADNPLPIRDYVVETTLYRVTGLSGGELGLITGLSQKTSQGSNYGEWTPQSNVGLTEYVGNNWRLRTKHNSGATEGSTGSIPTFYNKYVDISMIYRQSTNETQGDYTFDGNTYEIDASDSSSLSALYPMIHYGEKSRNNFGYVYDYRIRKFVVNEPVVSNITLVVFTNTIPTTPIAVNPLNDTYITSYGNVSLNVSSTDVDNDALTYFFYGDQTNGTEFIGNNNTVDGSFYNWTITQYGIYYWSSKAYDGFDYSGLSETFQFTLIAPPTLITPGNTSDQYETFPPLTAAVSFTWQDLVAPQYKLMVAEDENFNILSVNKHVSTNNSIQYLLVDKRYWWKVYSYDGNIYSDSSDVYSFNLTGNSTLTGTAIEGVVYQSNNVVSAITGAEVTIWNTTWSDSMITGSNGYYVFEELNSGTVYNLQAKSDRYWDSSIALVSAEDSPVTNNFYLIDDLTDTEWWHYVEFTLQNVWGVTYPDVATKVYIGTSPTIFESGTTGSDGTITFHLDQNIEYRITFVNSTHGINEETTLYPISKSYTVYIDRYSFALPDTVTDDIQAYIASSRINGTHGYINFTWTDTSVLTTSINYYIHDVDGNELYSTNNSGPDMFDSQIVTATDNRYIVRYVGIHPVHDTIDQSETVVFHGGRRVDFGWPHDWQYAVTALAFLIFIGSMFGARTAHYGAIAVVIFAWIFKWIGWLNETNTSTLLIILAAVIAFGWSLRKSEEVKM